jgi:hypothetical protein
MAAMPPHLTLPQAASLLGLDESAVLELIASGMLSQGSYGVPTAEVGEYLAFLEESARTTGPGAASKQAQ